jgi:cytochrome bd-type quinol oxidase subunit 2
MNSVNKITEREKDKFEQQRVRQRKITRILAAFFLPFFLGIGVISFITLSKAISRQSLVGLSALILAYSLLSGFVEYVKIKKVGQQRSTLFGIIQLLLFLLVSLLMVNLL